MKTPTFESIIRGKWLYDGCANLEEMATRLDAMAVTLRAMHVDGIKVNQVVEDDYAFISTDDAIIAEKYGLHEATEEECECDCEGEGVEFAEEFLTEEEVSERSAEPTGGL